MRITPITLALFTFFSTYAYANEECDILASLEADPSSVSSPVAFNDIQSSSVIYACSKAIVRNDEAKPRFLLQRARGYLKGGESEKAILDLASSGFGSTVRLAKSSADMWVPVFQQNRDNVLDVLDEHINSLSKFRTYLIKKDFNKIKELIEQSNEIRRILS